MTLDSGLRVMLMSRQKKSRPLLLLFAVISLSVMAADTENQPSDPVQPGDVPETSSQPLPQTGDAEPETQQDAETTPPVTGAAVKPLKEFKPTEQIEADSAVSFPVDI